jgi:hypothetical protein
VKYLCERQPELQFCAPLKTDRPEANNRVEEDSSSSFIVEGDETVNENKD